MLKESLEVKLKEQVAAQVQQEVSKMALVLSKVEGVVNFEEGQGAMDTIHTVFDKVDSEGKTVDQVEILAPLDKPVRDAETFKNNFRKHVSEQSGSIMVLNQINLGRSEPPPLADEGHPTPARATRPAARSCRSCRCCSSSCLLRYRPCSHSRSGPHRHAAACS